MKNEAKITFSKGNGSDLQSSPNFEHRTLNIEQILQGLMIQSPHPDI